MTQTHSKMIMLSTLFVLGISVRSFSNPVRNEVGNVNIDADHPNIQYIGRFDRSNPKRVIFDWPGVTIRATFTGTRCAIRLVDGHNLYNIRIDDGPPQVLKTDAETVYLIASDLPDKAHTIQIQKRTEALVGKGLFLGFIIDENRALLKPDVTPDRRIELIGDSITCGYGVEAEGASSPFTPETENASLTYAGLVGRGLRADYSLVAYSGRGVVRNYGDPNKTSREPLPAVYGRTCYFNEKAIWDFTRWIPQVVVINLGTNDYSTEPHPDQDVFQTAYQQLIRRIQSQYPDVTIFCVCGPLMDEPCATNIKNVVDQCRQTHRNREVHFIHVGRILTNADYGADWHPNIKGHQKTADIVLPFIREIMKWR